jgi:type II secretory pathway pseudopilin PulG
MKDFLLNNNKGYTLVETVVALAILIAVLIPISQLCARFINSKHSRDKIVATQLAQSEMEKAITNLNCENNSKSITINNVTWKIDKNAIYQNELIELRIEVSKRGGSAPVVILKTLRLNNVPGL